MLTSRTSRWSLGTAVVCVLLLVAAWFLLVGPRRADAAAIRTKADAADSQAATLQTQIAQLKAEFADLPKRQADLAAIKRQLPPQADIPGLVRTLQGLASGAGVSLDSIALGTPTVLTAGANAAPSVAGAGQVVSVPVTLQVTGDYFEAALFVKNLQTKTERSYLVTALSAQPAPLVAGGAPAGPAETVSPTAAPSVTPSATVSTSPTASPSATAASQPAVDNLDRMALTLNGSVFVLLDGAVTLDDVKKDVKAATGGGSAATPSPGASAGATPTASPSTSPTTAPTSSPAAN